MKTGMIVSLALISRVAAALSLFALIEAASQLL